MQNKKLILVMGICILLVGAAAFIGARLWSDRISPLDSVALGAPFDGNFRSMIVPAPELPTTSPGLTAAFVERQDNTIIVEMKSLEVDGITSSSPSNTRNPSGPQVKVVITGETMIYRETTNPSEPLSAENQTILQTVEPASLDDLDSQAMVMVWGRKSGDRVIAEVLMFSDLSGSQKRNIRRLRDLPLSRIDP